MSNSASGRRWVHRLAPGQDRIALTLAQRFGIDEIVARLLAARGVGHADMPGFLEPSLKAMLPDPSRLADMDDAADYCAAQLMGGKTGFAVIGDYDVDGTTSAALLVRYFAQFGLDIAVRIPDRLRDGFGPSDAIIDALHDAQATTVFCVDCGSHARGPLARAARLGMTVIVLDHHPCGDDLPMVRALVNPGRSADRSGLTMLAGVGVTFLFLVALNRALRNAGYFNGRAEPDLRIFLDLVALGTVCDIVPMTNVNRAFVARGVDCLARGANAGLAALCKALGLDAPTPRDLGFVLGPRLNAAGRLGEAGIALSLLICDDPGKAAEIAATLETCNARRREIERNAAREAEAKAAAQLHSDPHTAILVVGGKDFHRGVLGLCAARLARRHNRPALVIGYDGKSGTGSGRSVEGIDLGAAILEAARAGIVERGGGHAMAAGFSLTSDNEAALRMFLQKRLAGAAPHARAAPALLIDGLVSTGAMSLALAGSIKKAGPFGPGHEEPVFALADQRIVDLRIVGREHLRLTIADSDTRHLEAIAFRAVDTALGDFLRTRHGNRVHLAGKLSINRYRGAERPQLQVIDAARPVPASADAPRPASRQGRQ